MATRREFTSGSFSRLQSARRFHQRNRMNLVGGISSLTLRNVRNLSQTTSAQSIDKILNGQSGIGNAVLNRKAKHVLSHEVNKCLKANES